MMKRIIVFTIVLFHVAFAAEIKVRLSVEKVWVSIFWIAFLILQKTFFNFVVQRKLKLNLLFRAKNLNSFCFSTFY